MQTQHCGVIARQKKKLQVREKFICRSNIKLCWNNKEIASSLIRFMKKGKLFKLAMTDIKAFRNDVDKEIASSL